MLCRGFCIYQVRRKISVFLVLTHSQQIMGTFLERYSFCPTPKEHSFFFFFLSLRQTTNHHRYSKFLSPMTEKKVLPKRWTVFFLTSQWICKREILFDFVILLGAGIIRSLSFPMTFMSPYLLLFIQSIRQWQLGLQEIVYCFNKLRHHVIYFEMGEASRMFLLTLSQLE